MLKCIKCEVLALPPSQSRSHTTLTLIDKLLKLGMYSREFMTYFSFIDIFIFRYVYDLDGVKILD
jgi:hypothetical protein